MKHYKVGDPCYTYEGSRKQSWIGQATKTFTQIVVVYYILRLPIIWFLYSVIQQLSVLLEYLTALLECLTALLEYIDRTIGKYLSGNFRVCRTYSDAPAYMLPLYSIWYTCSIYTGIMHIKLYLYRCYSHDSQ